MQDGPTEHLLVERHGMAFRLDVIDGTTLAGPIQLLFVLPDDDLLPVRLATIRLFGGMGVMHVSQPRRDRRLTALDAVDARDAGASLREIADLLLGPGDWPGDGECRKSQIRRLIASGEALILAGPASVLRG